MGIHEDDITGDTVTVDILATTIMVVMDFTIATIQEADTIVAITTTIPITTTIIMEVLFTSIWVYRVKGVVLHHSHMNDLQV